MRLLKEGDDVTARDKHGYNALHLAIQSNQEPLLCHYLVQSGVPVDSTDNEGHTALHWAAFKGYPNTALHLIRCGADVNRKDNEGDTPLHWACKKGNTTVAGVLIDEGANVLAKDNQGKVPVNIAKQFEHEEMILYLNKRATVSYTKWRRVSALVSTLSAPVAMFLFCYFPLWLATIITAVYTPTAYTYVKSLRVKAHTPSPFFRCWFSTAVVLSYFAYFKKIYAVMPFWVDLFFCVVFFWMTTSFYMVTISNPGVLPINTATVKVIEDAIASGTPLLDFCPSCLLIKPLRSKHCSTNDVCISRFDHYCLWTACSVGQANHHKFILFLVSVVTGSGLIVLLAAVYFAHVLALPPLFPLENFAQTVFTWVTVSEYLYMMATQHMLVLWIAVFHFVHWLFALSVAINQFYCITANITVNESLNWKRYHYLSDECGNLHNPFDHGMRANAAEFFGSTIDYAHFYQPDFNALVGVVDRV
eukprot:TRINITY_DN4172_c0_g1_i3.p1 TRINITY_DN4172_c0_g1~~TRINITY_DN4172_c0_g1_i3.p1  ORF type:complete len:475 (-),score=103.05 TRINITY_DN4172_c0_g1_i3:878-2302(-)